MQKQAKAERLPLIGETIQLVEPKNKALAGITGRIIDETKNTITIQTEQKTKKIIKEQAKIQTKNKTIEGKNTIGRIETRIKQ